MTISIIGIDISKLKFDLCLLRENGKLKHKVFPNTPSGFAQLSAWLQKQKVERVHACMEATGTYGQALATYLFDAGHVVSVVNPAIIKAYAQSHLSRTKTDKADATLIARFFAERKPPAWHPLAREVRELQALVRRLESLLEMHQMEVNRLEAGVSADLVEESLTGHIAYLTEEIKRTTALIHQHIDQHPTLREQRELLISIPGIGNTTAAKLLAEMLDVKLYKSARQLAAFAGLVPRLHESGSSIKRKTRLSKIGAPRLRKALYFPAIAAIKYNPSIKAMSLRLKERGLCPMQIIGAAMRKLVHIAYGVLKSGKPFDPALVKTA
ncbi:MAG: IS110 family transposase [Acidobacteria bacterium]|nr:IS110 family transposase [Acidobacteriota bacterium]